MRITIIANSSKGLYRFRKELVQELVKEHDVTVLTPDYGRIELIRQLGCRVEVISMDRRGVNPIKDFSFIRTIFRACRDFRPELVISYTIKPNIYGGIVCQLLKIPYVANITGLGTAFQKENILKKFVSNLYKIAFTNVKIVLFENSENRRIIVQHRIVPEYKTCVLNGAGVNLEYFQFAEYPEKNSKTVFLFMGRIMKEKGFDELLMASQHLYDEGYDILINVLGTFEENYENCIRNAEKQGWLKYWGYQEEVRPFIQKANCFVLPSWHEGMANTNLESSSMGRPIITTNIPGCKEAVVDGESGYICKTKNYEDLYRCMRSFIELPYEEKCRMGLRARRHMEENFDKKEIVQTTMKVIFK